MKKEREWRDRFAQGKSRRENEKKRNIACAIKRDGERERERRGRMAQGKLVREKRGEKEYTNREKEKKREGGDPPTERCFYFESRECYQRLQT